MNNLKSPSNFGLFAFLLKVWAFVFSIQWLIRALTWFFVYHNELDISQFFESQWNGLSQDVSSTSYILVFITLSIGLIKLSKSKFDGFMPFLWSVFILIMLLVPVADIILLHYWGSRINSQALVYVRYPREIMASLDAQSWGLILIALIIAIAVGRLLIKKIKAFLERKEFAFPTPFFIIWITLCFVSARGGINKIPIQIGDAQKSNHHSLNELSLNSYWNLFYYLSKKESFPDIAHFKRGTYDFQDFITPYWQTSRERWIDSQFINLQSVCLIVMEGVSAEVSHLLEGKSPNCLTQSERWMKLGSYTSNFYSTGDRTNKGIASLLSGWPGNPWEGILHNPQKASILPNMGTQMKRMGLATNFYYGGDIRFANLKTYLSNGGFDNIYSQEYFDSDGYLGKWGYHDEVVLDQLYKDLVKSDSTSFTAVMLSSSHEPYDVVANAVNELDGYYQSVKYVDSCMNDFFEKVSHTEQLDSVLFIVTSDHGKYLQNDETQFGQRGFFRVPFWVYQNNVHPKSTLYEIFRGRCFSQADLYNTILDITTGEIDPKAKFSRSLLRKGHPNNAAFHMYEVGGIITPTEINWLSTRESLITREIPFNQWDSAILTLESGIISEFFKAE